MTKFVDDTARILASSPGRRQALRLIGGALLAGVMGTVAGCNANCLGSNPVYCAVSKVCCPSGTKYLCGGGCYPASGCPSNLLQTDVCG
jgi:hypothetical protein